MKHLDEARNAHLSDAELFALALPPAGQPEALPGHLSECLACSRALLDWKAAARDLAAEDAAPVTGRDEEEWRALERKTILALRRARSRRPAMPLLRWGMTIAAALLLVALVLPARRTGSSSAGASGTQSAELSAQDQADDALLRDVARLARAEDGAGSWSSLAPEPGGGRADEERS